MKYHFKKHFFFLTLLLCSCLACYAQVNAGFFQNFEIANHKIYVLHADGTIKVFAEDGRPLGNYSPKPMIKLLTKDYKDNIVVVDSANQVKRLNSNEKWDTIATFLQGSLFRIAFNNDNDCFLITNKGVVDVQTQKLYIPDKKLFHSEWAYHGNNALESDDNAIGSYMDKDNDLWFSFWHGEWGTDMFIWNTKAFNFIPFSKWAAMPVYEANNHLFAITGNFHDEYLVQYDKVYDQNKKLIEFAGSEAYGTETDPTYQKAKHLHDRPHIGIKELNKLNFYNFYVGGFTFNPNDGKMYIISSEGLLVADRLNQSEKFDELTPIKSFIFPRQITKAYLYYSNKKNETKIDNGYPQYVSKLQFTKRGKLVLLAPDNGVWLFDGKKLQIME